MTKIASKPYMPVATMKDILGYKAEDESTHTNSSLVNAVAEALQHTQLRDPAKLAEYLNLDVHKLSYALQIEIGMNLRDIVVEYKMQRVIEYINEHPNDSLAVVASKTGYSSPSALWRLYSRRIGIAPKSFGKQ